jgi:RNA polymerase sigma-32 factor
MNRPPSPSPLELYLSEVGRRPVLTAEEERALARRYRDHGDTRAAHGLVTANLRFVVRVAREYRSYGARLADLVQEGNLGLMTAVRKFDPEKGIRLVTYAVWWIRAYMQSHVLRSWSLVKLGTTQAQRRLFFSLSRTRREIARLSAEGNPGPAVTEDDEVAARLRVKPGEVRELRQRIEFRDVSLDAPLGGEGSRSQGDLVPAAGAGQDDLLAEVEERSLVHGRVVAALARLDPRERFIVERHLMSDRPMTLRDLGSRLGVSRERARQLEIRAREKLRLELLPLAMEIDWPTVGKPVEVEDPPTRSRTS